MSRTLTNILKPLEQYLNMEGANEIIINNPYEIIIDIKGEYKYFEDEEISTKRLGELCSILATDRGQLFNKLSPVLNTSIGRSGNRVTALHKSILGGQHLQFNIRIPPKKVFDLECFKIASNLEYSYEDIIKFVKERFNILIVGGTGSGKTQLLNSLLSHIDKKDRIITVEDSLEIMHNNKNHTQILVSKRDNGIYTYRDGIDSATRLSPQRLLLGELDTRNTLAFLRLQNTGHKGGISTIHANSTKSTINALSLNARFESGAGKAETEEYIKSAIDYIFYVEKNRFTNERVITEILKIEND